MKPSLPAYARVSYYRELHGDVDGAISAMRYAVSAGGSAEGTAYVETLLGDLELARGRTGAAHDAYRSALRDAPASPRPSPDSRASTRRAGGSAGRPPACGARRTALPLTTALTLLAEVETALGRRRAARADLAAARVQHRLLRRSRHAARRRGRAVRGEPRIVRAGGRAGPARVAARAEHPHRRRARLGAHARGEAGRRARVGAAGAADGFGRSDVPAARGRCRAPLRPARRGGALSDDSGEGGGGAVARGSLGCWRRRGREGRVGPMRASMHTPSPGPPSLPSFFLAPPRRRSRTRSGTSPSTTSRPCRSPRIESRSATSSTRRRSRPSRSAG